VADHRSGVRHRILRILRILLIGLSDSSASALGGVPLPLDLGSYFARQQWVGCGLFVDPLVIQPYAFDPAQDGGTVSFDYAGFDFGRYYVQALNVDPDFTTRIAGVSSALAVLGQAEIATGLVPIAPGTFQMGSNAPSGAPYFGSSAQQPVHSVTISYPFWIGQYEVTQLEYQTFMGGANPSAFLGANRPVETVSWNDARAYCQSLTAFEDAAGNLPAGYEYRLPTEAEWEYACRAGTTTEFNVGDELFCSDARFWYSYHTSSSCGNPDGTVDVGSYAPNAWGLFDMHGNVWEWCLDSYAGYSAGAVTDPFVTGGFERVFRGGSWAFGSSECSSADRNSTGPTTASFLGFRVVLAPVLVP
jgi:formylglycine-generating enzyme required for sulfatase activity